MGSGGSVGRQTVNVARRLGIGIRALAVRSNVERAEEQARLLRPKYVGVYDESAARDLRTRLADTDIEVGSGQEGLIEAAVYRGVDTVVTAVSGAVGLEPTLAALDEGLRVALANKETLVCAGELVMKRARDRGAEIIPVDSEHSAIFQCLQGSRRRELRRILLTASGGPFRGMSLEETRNMTPEYALRHPTWNMGAKISVDSATMMNKGLEFIEAMHLFSVTPDEIEVLVHPQSVVHSMVEFCDGAVIAQMGTPDMSLPIQYALTYPERLPDAAPGLDFASIGALSFEPPVLEQVPCLRLAMDCARRGGLAPTVMNAANEVAVEAFLNREISFGEIYEFTARAVDSIVTEMAMGSELTLEEILEADRAARSSAPQ